MASLCPAPPPSPSDSARVSELYTLLEPVAVRADSPRAKFTNWGLSFTCTPLAVFEPETEAQCEQILELARLEKKTVRVVGCGHSPSDLACTSGFMMRTERLDKVIEVNCDKRYVVCQAGITLNTLHVVLADHGLAMRNLGSISEQTIGGVVTTATHGTGITFPVLSMDVLSLVILLADGSRAHCSRAENPELFLASLCGLGSTGLILQIKLQVEPAFRLKEVQESHTFDDALRDMDAVVQSAEHVRYWWFPQADVVRSSVFNRTDEPKKPLSSWLWNSLIGYHFLQFVLFVARYFPALNIWYGKITTWLISESTVAVDDSYRIFNLDCKYPQYTTEWAIPYKNTRACLSELRDWLDGEFADPAGLRPHSPLEIRFSEKDDIWLSPGYGERMCWIGIIQYKPYGLNVPYRKLFSRFEQTLIHHGGKPHWAKTHPFGPEQLRQRYEHFDDFVKVLEQVDPHGMFRNPYVQRHIFGKKGAEYGQRVFKEIQ
ncbi:L-gulonolactone/D-arabinono-1,4-lactone oxidase [Lentinus tigrinus ALCF2SS1-7]|uniref:L-gulonolactone/D-arabinono-1,4-lactone oxidase n=1 Tax=Lentinus tigrinus ALCF2SS1-7 TaxID=1328758 RepID=UPI001165CE8A|nr:L-gulonolactone/D-arabinono-1,4-lactone oxidase [Lentinus tigrinus ALCF2SS1-7]